MTALSTTVEAAEARAADLKGNTDVIPEGMYCYKRESRPYGDDKGVFVLEVTPCPYWASNPDKERQAHGYCAFLKLGDWMENGTFLLWDQVKECGFNDEMPDVDEAE